VVDFFGLNDVAASWAVCTRARIRVALSRLPGFGGRVHAQNLIVLADVYAQSMSRISAFCSGTMSRMAVRCSCWRPFRLDSGGYAGRHWRNSCMHLCPTQRVKGRAPLIWNGSRPGPYSARQPGVVAEPHATTISAAAKPGAEVLVKAGDRRC